MASSVIALDTDGLVGAWLFDEGTGQTVKDSSGNELHGEVRGTPQWVKGRFEGAMKFGLLETVIVPDDDVLDLETFTLAAWVNIPWVPGVYQVIATKPNRNYGLYTNSTAGVIHYGFTTNGAWRTFDAKTVVTDSKWHHVTSTYDGHSLKVYLDGRLEAQASPRTKPDTTIHPFLIGGGGSGNSLPGPSGTIDEVVLYDRALSAEEVNDLMKNGMAAVLNIASTVTVSLTMPATVSVGEAFTAVVNIANAVDLAGGQLSLHFNPAVLEVSDIHQGDLLSGAGVFFQVEHFNSVPGEISGIRLVHTTGVDGDGVLLKVDFKAKGTGVSTLQVRDLKLGNSTGVPIASEVVFGEVEVKARPDVTGDGQVNILDLVRIARHFGPASAAPAGLDVNSDGDIDILDMILVAQHLGK